MPYADGAIELPCATLNSESRHEDLYQMGLVYSTGQGVAEDLIAAHKWFNLAALKGNEDAKLQRKELADMLSSEELGNALKAAREWLSLMN